MQGRKPSQGDRLAMSSDTQSDLFRGTAVT